MALHKFEKKGGKKIGSSTHKKVAKAVKAVKRRTHPPKK